MPFTKQTCATRPASTSLTDSNYHTETRIIVVHLPVNNIALFLLIVQCFNAALPLLPVWLNYDYRSSSYGDNMITPLLLVTVAAHLGLNLTLYNYDCALPENPDLLSPISPDPSKC